jgi:hypothetical protein
MTRSALGPSTVVFCRNDQGSGERSRQWSIGCDYHPSFQQIALVNTEGEECANRRLEQREEAERFYRSLQKQHQRQSYSGEE